MEPIPYDASRDALYRPFLRDPINPACFGGNPDALCAELSRLAYFAFPPDEARLSGALEGLGLGARCFFEDTSTNSQVFAACDAAGTAYVVFRGSEAQSTTDIATDGAFLRRSWDRGGSVHRGFANAYDSNGTCLRAALRDWVEQRAPRRLIATGHSLGAALATLFASDHPAAELVTFGSPLVGDAEFAGLFAGRTVRRYRDCCDGVTRVPPEWLGYRQVHGLRYIDRHGSVIDPTPSGAAVLTDMAAAIAGYAATALGSWSSVKLRDLADHAPINYVSALLGLREG